MYANSLHHTLAQVFYGNWTKNCSYYSHTHTRRSFSFKLPKKWRTLMQTLILCSSKLVYMEALKLIDNSNCSQNDIIAAFLVVVRGRGSVAVVCSLPFAILKCIEMRKKEIIARVANGSSQRVVGCVCRRTGAEPDQTACCLLNYQRIIFKMWIFLVMKAGIRSMLNGNCPEMLILCDSLADSATTHYTCVREGSQFASPINIINRILIIGIIMTWTTQHMLIIITDFHVCVWQSSNKLNIGHFSISSHSHHFI